jgi:uncharacterized protein YxeA
MKKIIFSILILLLIAGAASAQTSKHKNSRITTYVSTTSHKAKKPAVQKTTSVTTVNASAAAIPDNRTEYMQNGQLATYTGHQATPINADEFQSERKVKKNKKITKQ